MQFPLLVRWVDRYKGEASQRGGIFHQHPFRDIGCPHGNPLSWLEPRGQPLGQPFSIVQQFSIGPAPPDAAIGQALQQRVARAIGGRLITQQPPNRAVEDFAIGEPVAQRLVEPEFGHVSLPMQPVICRFTLRNRHTNAGHQ